MDWDGDSQPGRFSITDSIFKPPKPNCPGCKTAVEVAETCTELLRAVFVAPTPTLRHRIIQTAYEMLADQANKIWECRCQE